MKEIRICMEIMGLGIDENGDPCFGGVCASLGQVSEDRFQEIYEQLIKRMSVESLLQLLYLDAFFAPADCRIITPEEYDQKYGENVFEGKEGEEDDE